MSMMPGVTNLPAASITVAPAGIATVGGEVTNLKVSLDTDVDIFSKIGWWSAAIGGFLLLLAFPLKRLMHGVD